MELLIVGLLIVAAVLLVVRRLWLGATGRTDSFCGPCSSCPRGDATCRPDTDAGKPDRDADPPA